MFLARKHPGFLPNLQILLVNMQYILVFLAFILYMQDMESHLKLKLARVERGLSQQELADLVGAARQTIGLIEKGKYNPSLDLCLRIARALNRTLDELFWEDENDQT